MTFLAHLLFVNPVSAAEVGLKIGRQVMMGQFAGALKPGLTVSPEFMFGERFQTGPWLEMSLHNGTFYEEQALVGGPFIQGDSRLFTAGLRTGTVMPMAAKGSFRPQLGVGLMRSPLLMDEAYYLDEVVTQSWGMTVSPNYHDRFYPVVEISLEASTDTFSALPGIGLELVGGYVLNSDQYLGLSLTFRPQGSVKGASGKGGKSRSAGAGEKGGESEEIQATGIQALDDVFMKIKDVHDVLKEVQAVIDNAKSGVQQAMGAASFSDALFALSSQAAGAVSVKADVSSLPPSLDISVDTSAPPEVQSAVSALSSAATDLKTILPKVVALKDDIPAIVQSAQQLPQKLAEEVKAAKSAKDLGKVKQLAGAAKTMKSNISITLSTPQILKDTLTSVSDFFAAVASSLS